jgi:hypothetical protein
MALFCTPAQGRPHNVAGSYECTQVRVHGNLAPCRSAPLVLKKDGSFELRGWEGNYQIDGDWVELSDSVLKSRAKIEAGHKIIFRYHGKDGMVEVIYERRLAVLGKLALS